MSYSGFQTAPEVPVDPTLATKLTAILNRDSNVHYSSEPLKGRRSIAVFYVVELKCKLRNSPLPPFKLGYLRQWIRVFIKKIILKSVVVLFGNLDIPIESGTLFVPD